MRRGGAGSKQGVCRIKVKQSGPQGGRGALGLQRAGSVQPWVGSRRTDPVPGRVYKGCKPIFFHFHLIFLSLYLILSPLSLFSLLLCFIFSDGEGWWPAVMDGGAAAKTTSFLIFFQFPNPFILFYLFLPSKLSQPKSSTLDLNKNERKKHFFTFWIRFRMVEGNRSSGVVAVTCATDRCVDVEIEASCTDSRLI